MKPYDDPTYPRGKLTMRKVSPACEVGECWLCGRGEWFHRIFGWFLRHVYDPIREPGGFKEIQRLDQKYSKGG